MYSSPSRKGLKNGASPKKSKRPETATSPKKAGNNTTFSVSPRAYQHIKIIEELNGQDIVSQDKDIEIERLQTTCQSLNNRLRVLEDRRADNEVLKKRLAESEQIRKTQEQKINELQQENASLRSDMNDLME